MPKWTALMEGGHEVGKEISQEEGVLGGAGRRSWSKYDQDTGVKLPRNTYKLRKLAVTSQ